jgi:hypothetical protein
VVGSIEIGHLEGEGLSPEVGLIPKGDGQVDLPKWFALFPRYNAMERHPGQSDARPVDAHGVERLNVHDVEATTPIHQHLAEMLLVDDWINDKWVPTRMWNVVWVVGAVESNDGP